jgi:hypothetical protein
MFYPEIMSEEPGTVHENPMVIEMAPGDTLLFISIGLL